MYINAIVAGARSNDLAGAEVIAVLIIVYIH